MKKDLISILLCPACKGRSLGLEVAREDGREVREGRLACAGCGRSYPVREGMADLLGDPPAHVVREMEAWGSMRPAPRSSRHEDVRSRESLLALPMLEGMEGPRHDFETWRRHGRAVFALCEGGDWRGRRVLELGAGRCWLSAYLARQGAEVVAVDILDDGDIGLGCADVFLEDGPFFDRVLCDMQDLPFEADCIDAVVATAALHHAPRPDTLFGEIARVLKPRGVLLAANEPLYVPWRETPQEEAKGAHEGAYPLRAWLRLLRAAGLEPEEVKVGEDASLHLKAARAGAGREVPFAMEVGAHARYAGILALALPRRAVVGMRRLVAGRPMRPAPQDPLTYAGARLGLARVGEEASASEGANWGPGWYPVEGGEKPFRWSGPRSRLLLPPPPRGAVLLIELATFHPSPQTHPVSVKVGVGRRGAGSVHLCRNDWETHRIAVAPLRKRNRPVAVTLQVSEGCFTPRAMGLGDDRRRLGVACRGASWGAPPDG